MVGMLAGLVCIFMIPDARAGTVSDELLLRYRVQRNDQIGTVLNAIGVCPLWGKGNSVQKTTELNTDLKRNAKNIILPGQILRLPVMTLPKAKHYKVNTRGYVEFTIPGWKSVSLCSPVKQERALASEPMVLPEIPTEERLLTVELITKKSRFMFLPETFLGKTTASDLGTRTNASLFSKINFGGTLKWERTWKDKWQTSIYFRSLSRNFDSPQIGRIQNSSQRTSGLGFNLAYRLSENLNLISGFSWEQELYIRGITPANITLDRVGIPKLKAELDYRLVKDESGSLHVALGGTCFITTPTEHFTVKGGFNEQKAKLYWQEYRSSLVLQAGFHLLRRTENTSIVDQTSFEAGIALGMGIHF